MKLEMNILAPQGVSLGDLDEWRQRLGQAQRALGIHGIAWRFTNRAEHTVLVQVAYAPTHRAINGVIRELAQVIRAKAIAVKLPHHRKARVRCDDCGHPQDGLIDDHFVSYYPENRQIDFYAALQLGATAVTSQGA